MPTTTGTISHTTTVTGTDDATKQVSKNAWNATMIVSGGTSGDVMVRDSGKTDGWGFQTILPCANGGTGLASFAVGDLLYADGASSLTKLAAVASGSVLVSAGLTTAPAWSANPSLTTVTASRLNIAVTSTDGFVLSNAQAATGGVTVQMSPRLLLRGTAWDTAATKTVDFLIENLPSTAATPTGTFRIGYSLNGGAVTFPMTLTSAGVLTTLNQIVAGAALKGAALDLGNIGPSNGFCAVPNAGGFFWSTQVLLQSPANSQLTLQNLAASAGVGLDFATDGTLKLRTRAQTGYATLDVLGLKASGAAGVSFGPGAIASITIVNGIVTAAS